MEDRKIYEDIALRTEGDIYIGVVGPVRTGKSTFIKRFMESLVIPNIENVYRRERARDELPQSGSGRTIMTAEPKFVPSRVPGPADRLRGLYGQRRGGPSGGGDGAYGHHALV